jgi:hypothetical protein
MISLSLKMIYDFIRHLTGCQRSAEVCRARAICDRLVHSRFDGAGFVFQFEGIP